MEYGVRKRETETVCRNGLDGVIISAHRVIELKGHLGTASRSTDDDGWLFYGMHQKVRAMIICLGEIPSITRASMV